MAEPSSGGITFLILNDIMPLDHRKAVVKRALDYWKQALPTSRQRMEKAIQNCVKMRGGFRKPMQAPVELLLKEVVAGSYRSNALLGAVLQVWVESHSALQAAVRDFLTAKRMPIMEISDLKDGFTGAWTTTTMLDIAADFRAEYSNFGDEDARLMLCCLAGCAPLPDEITEEFSDKTDETMREPGGFDKEITPKGEVRALKWEKWLQELRFISADAIEWEEANIKEFIEALQKLSEEKRLNREETRGRLRKSLATLVEQAADQLDYFDMKDVAQWTAEACPLAEIATLAEQVEQFREALIKHRELIHRPPANRAESRQWRKELDEFEEEIIQVYQHLDSVFMPSPSPEESPESEGGLPVPERKLPEKPPEPSGEEIPRLVEKLDSVLTPSPSPEEPPEPEGESLGPEEEPPEKPSEPSGEEIPRLVEKEETPPADTSGKPEQPPMLPPALYTSQEIGTLLQTKDRNENWHAFLWTLIAEDDLPAAYWLARSLVASGEGSPVPDWLLAAAQGARWLSFGPEAFTRDLLEIAKNYLPVFGDVQRIMIRLAAALCPALTAPFRELLGWLEVPDRHRYSALYSLVDTVSTFANLGMALQPEDLLGVAGAEQREAALTEAARAAKRWLDEATSRRTKFKRASDVWRHLVGPKGDLRALLLPVSEDRRAEAERVRQYLHQWQQYDHIWEKIDQIDQGLIVTKAPPIVGAPRLSLIRNAEEACNLAKHWCDLVEHEREIKTRGNWLFERVAELRASVQKVLPEVEIWLSELSSPAQPASQVAAARCLWRAVRQLREILGLPSENPETELPAMNTWEWLPCDAENLFVALSRRLLWLPEVQLSEEGEPSVESLLMIAPALRDACAQRRTLRVAFEGWLQKQDYRFVGRLLDALRNEPDAAEVSRCYQEALDGSRAALREDIDKTESTIEQAVVDGIIAEERSEYSAKVVLVNPDEVLNFPPKYEEMRNARESLSEARQKRLAELHKNWESYQKRLLASNIKTAIQKRVRNLVTSALKHGDTRVVEECLARLTEGLDYGHNLEDIWPEPSDQRDVLEEFMKKIQALEEALSGGLPAVIGTIRDRRELAGLSFYRLPKDRLEEAVRTTEAWRQLKQQNAWEHNSADRIDTILRYLGFTFKPGMGPSIERSGAYWVYMRPIMSASEHARPIPQFGSQAKGRYDVVCVWERPTMDVMSAWLHDLRLDARSTLVLYLGRMSAQQRRFMARTSRERDLAIAVLDEILLLFLAGEHRARLPFFLRCALPFAAVNPYTPFQAGDVPPEMFFGRDKMARELQRPEGSCLVYGGRQLGKSALLRHVQRKFHNPEDEQYAWVEDIKLVGDPVAGQPTHDAIWWKLRDSFKALKLIPQRITTGKPEEILRYLRDAMEQKPKQRALVLFDEADNFLEADSRDNFRVVEALRTLMLDTQRRFKVIFAGLHNVQRFQGIPNQPLAHFGAPLCVGPLEPDAAQKLVRDPLEALGYRFSDDATVLRILSYTNYHPGLIQLFCQELLKRLHSHRGNTMPPYRIEQSDVEAVYRNPQVRDRIRERFDWTLALDIHYQAIAWTLIVDQMEMRDSYAQAYPPGDILGLVRYWWLLGFSDMGIEKLRSLLDEMCGLGVMVRNTDGHYRLRSPNLVRLMGTEADILNRLSELSKEPPPKPPDPDSYHTSLDDAARRYSPLTYSQERSLNPPRSGVGLVFASEALGLSMLPEAFKRFIPPNLPEDMGACTETPSWVTTDDELRSWLSEYIQACPKHERLVVYHRFAGGNPENLENMAQEALNFCHRSRKRWMRMIFFFDSQATWTWLSLPQNLREDLEYRADAVVFPCRWNLVGLRQRLAQHDKMHPDEVCQKVLQATNGWPYLLDVLFDRCGTLDDPRPFAQEIEHELMDLNSQLRQQFCSSLGLEENDIARRVLEFVLPEREVPTDLVTPELIGGNLTLTSEECIRAIEYLYRMSCLEQDSEMVSVETIVKKMIS